VKISILYFEGCPNHRPVVEMVGRLVNAYGLDVDLEEVEIAPHDVVPRRFLGSPTVQVDGLDIEPAARDRTDFAMSCRVYATPDGLPPEQMLLASAAPAGLRSVGRRGCGVLRAMATVVHRGGRRGARPRLLLQLFPQGTLCR
jgi:hypothetical protein